MSSAFVKEEEGQWLHDIDPTMPALINYLSRENNGIRVYEVRQRLDKKTDTVVYDMSNGLSYGIANDGKWMIVW